MAFTKSAQWLERSQRVLAGGVSSDVRRSELPHPLFFTSGKGSRLFDVDGNEYIDYVLGQGPLLLGHSPRAVLDAVHEQLERGLIYAAQHEAETQLAELLTEIIPCAEKARFNSTGSEAVVTALRIARAYRNRPLIVKFEGQWHGWYDSLFISTSPTLEQAGPYDAPNPVLPSSGQVRNAAENVIVVPWNDLDLLTDLFRQRGREIAGVITEPMMCNAGSIAPLPGFLQGLRQLCDQYESTLIFDEVITGFRLALGGAQEAYGVVPDLATYAKGIASGLTLSAVAGKRDWMDLISTGKVVHAGTYNSNPVAIAAGLATVRHLKENREKIYNRFDELGAQLREGLLKQLHEAGLATLVTGRGPVVQVSLTDQTVLRNYRDWIRRDTSTYHRLVTQLVDHGIRTISRGTWYLSAAHTGQDIRITLDRFASVLHGESRVGAAKPDRH
jgi:glutamate-1-semialdehyde 2,1-aminomutase